MLRAVQALSALHLRGALPVGSGSMRNLLAPTFRSIRLLSRAEKATFFGLLSARILTNFLDVVGIAGVALFGAMLAAGLTGQNETSFGFFSIELEDSAIYLWVILAVVVLFLTKSVIAVLLLRANGLFLARVEAAAAVEVMQYFYGQDLSRVKANPEARIEYAVSTSTSMAFANLLSNLNSLVTESALFLFMFVAFAFTDWQTALLVSLYFFLLIGGFQWSISKRLKAVGQTMADSHKRVFSLLRDINRAYRELVVAAKLDEFSRNFKDARILEARTWARLRFYEGSPRFFIESALMLGVLGLVGWQFAQGSLSEGLVVTAVFMAGGVRMMGALLPLQNAVSWIRMNAPQAEDAQQILELVRASNARVGEREIRYPGGGLVPVHEETLKSTGSDLPVEIRMANVSFRYPDAEEDVIDKLSLEIPAGAVVALIGPSGAGKTTIVDLILGLFTPSSGTVRLSGLTPQELRKHNPGSMSYVPQKPGMIAGSISENVALGVETSQVDETRVRECLEVVGLLEAVEEMGGIFSDLGPQVDALSGGQLQRLGLARALYAGPRLIVLDEATSALDAGSESEVVKYIESLRGSTTVVIIAHRLSTVQRVDNVFVVDRGKLFGEGTFAQVRKKVPLVEEYVRLMSFD